MNKVSKYKGLKFEIPEIASSDFEVVLLADSQDMMSCSAEVPSSSGVMVMMVVFDHFRQRH